MSSRLHLMVTVALLAGSTGCWSGSLFADRPKDRAVDHAVDELWAAEIRRVARDGDWILSRSLTPHGDVLTTFSPGEEFSHASMVDVTHGTVIEGITPVVREIPLVDLMARNRYVVVVRPSGLDAEQSRAALERARAEVGKEFDLFGLIGYSEPDKWYCSELVYWASGFEDRNGPQAIVFPAELMEYGEVIYYSGRRDDPQVQAIAAARLNLGHDTAVAGASSTGGEAGVEPEE